MFQTKKTDKTPKEQLCEVEIGNLTEKNFRVMIIKMIQDLRKRMNAQCKKLKENFNKELENIKNNQS